MISVLALITNHTFGYAALLTIHIGAIIGAFGPLMVSAPLNRLASSKSGDEGAEIARVSLRTAKTVSMPPFIIAVLAGMGLVGTSNDLFKFDQQWITFAFSLVLVIALVWYFMLLPAQKRLVAAVQSNNADDKRSARAISAAATGVIHLCMLLLIIDMIWKPGL